MADDENADEMKKTERDRGDTRNNNTKYIYTKEERTEYFIKLEKWLQEAYAWQSVAALFPHYVLSGQVFDRLPTPNAFVIPRTTTNATAGSSVTNAPTASAGARERQNANESVRRRVARESGNTSRPPGAEGYEYRIPPIWKRFVAEFIDTIMLLMLKLVITFFTLDLFASISLEPYSLDFLQSDLLIDYKMAVEVASRVLIWEMLHRFIVCVYEAFWLQHGMNGTIGGASPGKFAMGLIVVQCRGITPVEHPDADDMVFVSPGTDLGLPLALGRSVVKNLIMAFLFPICFALFFKFNRTGYDLACNSIVVEDPLRNANGRFRRR